MHSPSLALGERLIQRAVPHDVHCHWKLLVLLFLFLVVGIASVLSSVLCIPSSSGQHLPLLRPTLDMALRMGIVMNGAFSQSAPWPPAALAPRLWHRHRTLAALSERAELSLQNLLAESQQGPFSYPPEVASKIEAIALEVEESAKNSLLDSNASKPDESLLLDGSWDLLFDSEGARAGFELRRFLQGISFGISELIAPRLLELPQFQLSGLRQDVDSQGKRLKNFVSLAPWPRGLQLPGPLGDVLDQLQDAKVTLAVNYRLEADGTIDDRNSCFRIEPEKIERSLTRSEGQDFDGPAAIIPTSTFLGQPQFPVPEPLRNLGTERFSTTVVGGGYRISRGLRNGQSLRIFRRREAIDDGNTSTS